MTKQEIVKLNCFKNLEKYDEGKYAPSIINIINKKTNSKDFQYQEYNIDSPLDYIEDCIKTCMFFNNEFSSMNKGEFKDIGTFEAIIAKYSYYDNYIAFLVDSYISLQKCHVFHDGNKRTSLAFLIYSLGKIGYTLNNTDLIADLQILFIERKVILDIFKTDINNNICKR